MRFFIFLLTLIFTLQPLFAQPINRWKGGVPLKAPPQRTSLKGVSPEELQRQQQEQTEQRKWQNALKELRARQNPLNWKEITWQEFLKQNKNTKGVEAVSTHLDIKCTEAYCELLPGKIPLEAIAKSGNSEVDYQTILAGYKLIYVGEGMNHDTQRAPLEMAKILRAAREANPGAKILLAAEFLVWTDTNNLPKEKQYLAQKAKINQAETDCQIDFEKLERIKDQLSKNEYQTYHRELTKQLEQFSEYNKYCTQIEQSIDATPLLKKAGEKSDLYFLKEYAPVFQTADELGIDQLALDDDIPGLRQKKEIAAKAGEFIVWANPQDKIPSWNAIRKRSASYEDKRYAALEQNLGVSPWGVRERNREWARRIKILQPFYDIIIVYAGTGHLSNTYYMDLQPMVKQKDYLDITLYPMEELPAEKQAYYNQRFKATEKSQITQDARLWEEIQSSQINLDQIITNPDDESFSWEDLQKPFWVWYNDNNPQLKQVMQTWDQEKTKAWTNELNKQKEQFPFLQTAHLEVFLPFE